MTIKHSLWTKHLFIFYLKKHKNCNFLKCVLSFIFINSILSLSTRSSNYISKPNVHRLFSLFNFLVYSNNLQIRSLYAVNRCAFNSYMTSMPESTSGNDLSDVFKTGISNNKANVSFIKIFLFISKSGILSQITSGFKGIFISKQLDSLSFIVSFKNQAVLKFASRIFKLYNLVKYKIPQIKHKYIICPVSLYLVIANFGSKSAKFPNVGIHNNLSLTWFKTQFSEKLDDTIDPYLSSEYIKLNQCSEDFHNKIWPHDVGVQSVNLIFTDQVCLFKLLKLLTVFMFSPVFNGKPYKTLLIKTLNQFILHKWWLCNSNKNNYTFAKSDVLSYNSCESNIDIYLYSQTKLNFIFHIFLHEFVVLMSRFISNDFWWVPCCNIIDIFFYLNNVQVYVNLLAQFASKEVQFSLKAKRNNSFISISSTIGTQIVTSSTGSLISDKFKKSIIGIVNKNIPIIALSKITKRSGTLHRSSYMFAGLVRLASRVFRKLDYKLSKYIYQAEILLQVYKFSKISLLYPQYLFNSDKLWLDKPEDRWGWLLSSKKKRGIKRYSPRFIRITPKLHPILGSFYRKISNSRPYSLKYFIILNSYIHLCTLIHIFLFSSVKLSYAHVGYSFMINSFLLSRRLIIPSPRTSSGSHKIKISLQFVSPDKCHTLSFNTINPSILNSIERVTHRVISTSPPHLLDYFFIYRIYSSQKWYKFLSLKIKSPVAFSEEQIKRSDYGSVVINAEKSDRLLAPLKYITNVFSLTFFFSRIKFKNHFPYNKEYKNMKYRFRRRKNKRLKFF